MLSAGKILLTLIVVVAVAFVVRLLNRRAALKAAPQPPAAPRTRTVDLEHCGACNAYVARGSGACARLDCPMRA